MPSAARPATRAQASIAVLPFANLSGDPAKRYFSDVQTKTIKYKPLMAPSDQPAIWLNAEKMARFRDEMRKYYYDPTKYATYLEQLGITYPTIPPVP